MVLHEKSLELNITHEILNLADSWHWFLKDISLWRYWRPRYKLPFIKYPKSTAGGFHITTEGKDDPNGAAGGGFDVRIKSGIGDHLLFIQYKMGRYETQSPDPKSIFNNPPFDHYKFKINSESTNQHFLLRNLANGIGAKKNNAVVYAFPLIKDMEELEKYSGKLVRRTKFISIADIDNQAQLNNVIIQKGKEHSFRIGCSDMSRCEVNYFFFKFLGEDRTGDVISDLIAIRFRKILINFTKEIQSLFRVEKLNISLLSSGIRYAFIEYIRYLFHYFEVSPSSIENSYINIYFDNSEETLIEFSNYENNSRDIQILNKILKQLEIFYPFIENPLIENQAYSNEFIKFSEIPYYHPRIFIEIPDNKIEISIINESSAEEISKIMYLKV